MKKTLLLLGSLALPFPVACIDLDDGDDGAGTTMSETPSGACSITESMSAETHCGEVDCGSEDGSDSGGEDACGEDEATQAVVSCILQAEADGIDYRFHYTTSMNAGQFQSDVTYHVTADGSMWRSRQALEDLCQSSDTTVYAAVDPSACSDWACIRDAMNDASVVDVCASEQNCDDGI